MPAYLIGKLLGPARRISPGRPVEMKFIARISRDDVEVDVHNHLVCYWAIVLKDIYALAARGRLYRLDQRGQVAKHGPGLGGG